jgi:hypothetical protein
VCIRTKYKINAFALFRQTQPAEELLSVALIHLIVVQNENLDVNLLHKALYAKDVYELLNFLHTSACFMWMTKKGAKMNIIAIIRGPFETAETAWDFAVNGYKKRRSVRCKTRSDFRMANKYV